MLVLDLGCGEGAIPIRAQVAESDCVIGIDINRSALRTARQRFSERCFVASKAEFLPFRDNTFARVISSVAVPYTHITMTLAEARRVLTPEGTLFMSLHKAQFTFSELRSAIPRPLATLFRMYVLLNGLVFHLTGRLVPFVNGRIESFQTERAMRRVLAKAGFGHLTFSRPGNMFIVQATLQDKPTIVIDEGAPVGAHTAA